MKVVDIEEVKDLKRPFMVFCKYRGFLYKLLPHVGHLCVDDGVATLFFVNRRGEVFKHRDVELKDFNIYKEDEGYKLRIDTDRGDMVWDIDYMEVLNR